MEHILDIEYCKKLLKATLCINNIYDDYYFNTIIEDNSIIFYNTFFYISFYKNYIFFFDLVKEYFEIYIIKDNIIYVYK